jgi:hypothetical protein
VYGAIGLSELFEMREECLREFGFSDVYRCDEDEGMCDLVLPPTHPPLCTSIVLTG